ncbi:hypothetical protein FH581_023195 (plasmid) [Leptospira weilii]|uniref:hypothetical protein n=1 Tax=Leptospira weilii TaxID=28184 RepID=UPI00201B71A0|nr:hypothetical protein [Leptospira weilii]UPY81117.1 hypothetical protein FH581_022960 [Leptospira weilii]UPY81159.1 hypothetical protein FH581_023195 [Leptospira weilii]
MPEAQVTITNNEVKIYYQNQFQKITARDINRMSGAETENSIVPVLLSAILATIGQDSETAIGFEITFVNSNTIRVSSGIIIRTDSVYIVPELLLSPSSGSLEGIFEIELTSSLTDQKAVPLFNTQTERFTPQARPTRKTFSSQVFEQWNGSPGIPPVSVNRIGLLSYRKNSVGGPVTTLSRLLPVYDPKLIGIDVDLDPGIGENDSLAEAINWIYNHFENKDFIKTTPSPGYDNANFRIRTQGNLAFWSKNEGGNWLPFA